MTTPEAPPSASRWLEPLLALIVAGGVVWAGYHWITEGFLPQPFFYEPFDIWADWFNTAYWARDPGTYDTWRTIYPPLSFVFLQMFGLEHCYPIATGTDPSAGLMARGCDWPGYVTLHAFFLINAVLVYRIYKKIDPRSAPWRAFALAAGLPMLDGLERGNLIIVSFTCLVLAYGPLLRSARLRWVFAGLAINFKVYLIAALFPLLLRRKWRWVEGALVATVMIYLLSYAWLGRGTPKEIVDNILSFNDQLGAAQLLDLWYATTYRALLSLLGSSNFPMMDIIGSRNVDLLLVLIPAIQYTVQASLIAAAVAIWLRPEVVPLYRVINIGLMLALITSEAGGYTQAYFIFFIFMERWKGFGIKWAIVAAYVLSIPLDIPLDRSLPVVRPAYFPNTTIIVNYYIMLGPFVRPLIVLTIAFAIACATLRTVWLDSRANGWRDRWRFAPDVTPRVTDAALDGQAAASADAR